MLAYQIGLLKHFYKNEKDYYGNPVDWSQYDFVTMQELDRLRNEIKSPCKVIRGNHGFMKETAVDAVFPSAPFSVVVMALYRSGFSKGVYEGGSIHLDQRQSADGLYRSWMAFRPETTVEIANRGLRGLYDYSSNGWDYYSWYKPKSYELLKFLIDLNERKISLAPQVTAGQI